uniref:Uncharacterized protein n=2 Tax=Babesia TaxID=5864 RepID=A0A411ADA0_9APIC|nr:hypothetical protein [Babesia motasi]
MITYLINKIESYIIYKIISILEFIFWFTMAICVGIDNLYINITKRQQIKSYIIYNKFIIAQNLILYLLNYYSTESHIIQDYTLLSLYLNINNMAIYNFVYKLSNFNNLDIIHTVCYL